MGGQRPKSAPTGRQLKINVLVDVGANIGWYSKHLRMMGYRNHILSFEPLPHEYASLERKAREDRLWQTYNFALGTHCGTQEFNVDGVCSSFLNPIRRRVDKTETVEIRRLDDVLDEALDSVREPRIFLKMDTQGYDLEVVGGVERYLDSIVGLQSEISVFPLYDDMPHYTQALDYYESLGFSLMDLFVVNRTSYNGILEYDCVMARKEELGRNRG